MLTDPQLRDRIRAWEVAGDLVVIHCIERSLSIVEDA